MSKRAVLSVIFLAILACFSIDSAFAESNKKATKTNKQTSAKNDVTVFDLTRTTLPLAYSGHDVMKIYNALNSRKEISKSEFETTEQFDKRLANEQSKPILGKLTVNDVFAFMIKPEVKTDYKTSAQIKYDADKNLMDIFFGTSSVMQSGYWASGDSGYALIEKKRSEKSNGSYNGTNAYGAITKVRSSITEVEDFVLTDNLSLFEPSIRPNNKNINFVLEDISPDIAKAYKDNIRILIIAKLEKPYISYKRDGDEPTFSNPREYIFLFRRIHCSAIEMWVYNFKTGEILKKFKIPSTTPK